jgi:L-iditol 2-dehydrogenase
LAPVAYGEVAFLLGVVKERKGDGYVELREVPEPSPSETEVLVRVGAAGICGSDLNILHDVFPGYNVPVILGHEFAGTVERVGVNVPSIAPGDRVVCETHAYVCNLCTFCKTGLYNLCSERKGFGYGLDGAFTKYVKVREPIVHKLPENISLDEAAVLEPVSVVVNGLLRNSKLQAGESVVIFGPGPIGLLSAQIAKLSGAAVTVVGTRHSAGRLNFASSELKVDSVIEETEFNEGLDSGDAYRDKFDAAVIATGSPKAFEPALRSVRKSGLVVQLGESTHTVSFQMSLIERKNLRLQGSFSHNWPVWEKAISLVRDGKIKVSPLITHKVKLEDWRKGFDLAESREAIKVLIKP